MIVAPLFLLAASIVAPAVSDTGETAVVNAVAGDLDMSYAATVLFIAGAVFLVPAVLGLMHLLRERQVALGHIGGALALLGTMMFMLFGGAGLFVWQMLRGGTSPAETIALVERFTSTTGSGLFQYLCLAFPIGTLLLAFGLQRARIVHWSTTAMLSIGAVVLGVGIVTNLTVLFIVASAVLFAGFATIGLRVLTETDEAWEHTPEWSGFRPVTH